MSNLENDRPYKRRRTETKPSRIRQLVNVCTQHLATPNIPIIISSYLRVLLHATGILFILFVTSSLIQSFTTEIRARYQSQSEEYAEQARLCHQNYISHHCGPTLRGVTWQSFCDEWDKYPLKYIILCLSSLLFTLTISFLHVGIINLNW
ncbi:uncharacterized protein B0P05DRAFT_536210 [Gilbertella persicaria]|uniref:uncharacterized protein n=1 Tax=Gilbertella persicaria TaxID=101096 RepID=UPI00221F4895|nr:uncharacterized protein B0P05DRAFT_536210 [Gilbertella persicaria]KAI8084114.1 hypothetical protein B0P05DRAFT_536210 [Gilbertella persicaria]